MIKSLLLIVSHSLALLAGLALGIYLLPILTAPPAPVSATILAQMSEPRFQGEFVRDLADSDWLHWGEGKLIIGEQKIALVGTLAPGPDYRLYLSPQFVETEAAFNQLKPQMVQVGNVTTFENFSVPLPSEIDPGEYNTVVIWCEAFGQFISAARYR